METTSTLAPAEVARAMVAHGVAKHRTRVDRVFFKAVLAGVMLSFGGMLAQVVGGGSAGLTASNPGLVKILSGFVFPVGLVMIVLQGFELLTSNLMVMPMAAWKRAIPWWSVPLNWTVVTFGNLCGSLFFASVMANHSGLLSVDPYASYAKEAALTKAAKPTWEEIFIRGIGCNWLVCVAIWQAAGAKETISKVFAIWLPIWVFVACGFDHVVANMFSIPLGIMLGADLSAAGYIRKSLIAAWIGNLVGALLVAVPAVYFYLSTDASADALVSAEEGEGMNGLAQTGADSPSLVLSEDRGRKAQ